jgi:hypothetical protein
VSTLAPVILPPPPGADTEYQVRYATNLNISDSIFDVTNTGANVTNTCYGDICVNVFGLSKGKLIACCSCPWDPTSSFRSRCRKTCSPTTTFPPIR